jgi:GDP-L-galactose phosphorylase
VQVTDGVYGFIAQLNEGRATKKRATEFRVDKVCQPFDASKFNFQKAAMKEVLFQFTAGAVHHTQYRSAGVCGPSPNLVLINVSPIEYGHVLLVPRVNDCIPQVVDQTAMLFALQCANEVHNPCFRLGYNSLGAFGTINHLHFQGYFLSKPYPVERAPTKTIPGLEKKVGAAMLATLQPAEGFPRHTTWHSTPAALKWGLASLELDVISSVLGCFGCSLHGAAFGRHQGRPFRFGGTT